MASYIFTTFIFVWEDPNILLEELIEVSLWIQAQPGLPQLHLAPVEPVETFVQPYNTIFLGLLLYPEQFWLHTSTHGLQST